MDITVENNKIIVGEDELDIFTSKELLEKILELKEEGTEEVTLDLGAVEWLSASGLQVIESARKSFETFKIENLHERSAAQIKNLGIDLS